HRGGVQVQPVGDPFRPPPPRDPQTQDPPLGAPVQLVGAAARPAGPVAHPGLAVGAVPVRPSLGGRYRHAIPVSRSAQRPPLINDAPRQTQPAGRSQRSITVRHETSGCSEPSSSYTSPGGLTYVQHPTACHQPPWSVHLDDGAWYPVRGTLLCDTATGDRLVHTCRDHPVTSAQADGVAEYAPPHQARRGLRSTTRQARPQWRAMAPAEGPREQSRDWSTMTF